MGGTSQQVDNGKQLGGCTGKGWLPGQSGNPKGGPHRPKLTDRLRDVLDQDAGAGCKALVSAGVKAALGDPDKGVPPDFRFWNAIYERIEGKVIERIAMEDNGPLFRIVVGIIPQRVCGVEPEPKLTKTKARALLESDAVKTVEADKS